jgi:DNA-binding NtrC family response regulator
MESGSLDVSHGAPLHFLLPPTRLNNGKKLEPLGQQISELEKMAITQALEATQGNKSNAAKLLGISRAKLYACLGNASMS